MTYPLREWVFLIPQKKELDESGAWVDVPGEIIERWAHVRPLSPLTDISHQTHGPKAHAPTESPWKERYEIHVRALPALGPIGRIVWREKILTPLTSPQPSAHGDYVMFQALVLKHIPQKEVPHVENR